MRVGIMSMQRVVNYGSFLQAYSLKKNIEELGNQVEFVDYQVEPPIVEGKKAPKEITLKKICEKLLPPYQLSKEKMSVQWKNLGKVEQIYNNEMLPLLGITEKKNIRPQLDTLVIGSDEVFNCLQTNENVGYSKELFGYNSNADKVISYAASFGNTTEEGLRKYNIYDEVKEMLSKFSGISVRDKNTYEILTQMSNKEIDKNVDPVFLYDFKEETNIEVPIDNYIVVYAYSCRIQKNEARLIKKFAKKYNKKIVCLCNPQRYLDGYLPLNPFEVLAYIRKADYVITDTFHGTVFSIKNNKQFVTFIRKGHELRYGNNEKLYDLLNTFKLTQRIAENVKDIETVLLKPIDYKKINEKIAEEAEKGRNYLKRYVVEN